MGSLSLPFSMIGKLLISSICLFALINCCQKKRAFVNQLDVSILGEIESSFGEITYTQNVSAHDTVCARGGNLETVAANAYLDKEKKKPCQGYSAEASSALVFYFAAVPDKNNINNCKVAKTDEPD